MTKTMSEVLAEHQKVSMGMTSGSADTCKCGERLYPDAADDEITFRRDKAFAAHQAAALSAAGFGLVGEAWPEYEWACQIGGLIYPHNNEADARRDATFKGKHERKVVRRIKAGAWEDQS